jgi:hypothetical protein
VISPAATSTSASRVPDVNQAGNVADGHIVAGNLTTTSTTNVYLAKKSYFEVLNEKLKAELAGDAVLRGLIAELQHFFDRAPNSDIRGLAAKLNESGRADLISIAEGLKEDAAKKILKYQPYHYAQQLFVHALADMYMRFLMTVTPKIEAGAPREEIDPLVHDKVIEPVLAALGENILAFNKKEIAGLLYFLAGNCHIAWDKYADIPPSV